MDFTPKTYLTLLITISSLLLTKPVLSTRDIHVTHQELREDLNELCKKTTNPALCSKTIQPHVSETTLEPIKALNVEVDATLTGVKAALTKIKSLEALNNNEKSTKKSLSVCDEQYSSMLDAIAETKLAIARKDVVTAKFKFSAVLSYQAACQDNFQDGKIPFNEDSEAVFKLGGIALDIIASIEKNMPPLPPVKSAPSAFSSVIGTIS
ncbi:hypothetical protein ACSQ67_012479 [Phaseolus vulgaris]